MTATPGDIVKYVPTGVSLCDLLRPAIINMAYDLWGKSWPGALVVRFIPGAGITVCSGGAERQVVITQRQVDRFLSYRAGIPKDFNRRCKQALLKLSRPPGEAGSLAAD